MDALEIESVGREVDGLVTALEEERFLHVAGRSDEPAIASIFRNHSGAAHRDTARRLRDAGAEELARRVGTLRAERAAAEAEERWRAADARAVGVGPRGSEPLASLELALPRERDPERRASIARAAADATGAAASEREAWAEVRARARAEVGIAPDWRVVVEGDQALAASDDAYRDVLAFASRRELGRADALSRADLLHVIALARWDGLFRPGMLPLALRDVLERLGIAPGKVRVDAPEGKTAWPGAHAIGPRVSFRPRGGAGDWQDLLAAAARALVAGSVAPCARDAVLSEALAWILGSLVLEPRWLADRADVERRHAPDVVRDLALRRAVQLRADAAALRVATEVERGLSGAAWREAHRDAVTAATGAAWDRVRASRDADPDLLGARVAGAAAGERLRLELRERFDEDWWRNPRTGPHLAALLAAGRLPPSDAPPQVADAARSLAGRLGA
jgi:hypothetical protein